MELQSFSLESRQSSRQDLFNFLRLFHHHFVKSNQSQLYSKYSHPERIKLYGDTAGTEKFKHSGVIAVL